MLRRRVFLLAGLAALPAFAQHERMAALHETVVSAHEAGACVGIFSYDHDPGAWLDNLAVGKLRVGVDTADGTRWLAPPVTARNLPGGEGVELAGTIGEVAVTIEALPTAAGRDTMRQEGAALLKITARPAARLRLRYGAVGRVRIHGWRPHKTFRPQYLIEPELAPVESATSVITVDGAGATFVTPALPAVAVSLAPAVSVSAGDGWVEAAGESTATATALVGFAAEPDRARELAAADPTATEGDCRERFRELLTANLIDTPDDRLDAAYRAAVINLEYAWVRPIGWIESLHHWGTMWTMQHSWAADWLGQTDRTREMILTHADRLMPSGQVPDLDPSGRGRVDFGGWNHFYAWCVQHYWRQTHDLDFARRIIGPLGRVVDQTFAAHDPDGNGLLGFGQQIGNQEDYIATPSDGTSPSIAGIEMLRTMAELHAALGESNEAAAYRLRAARSQRAVLASLFDDQLQCFLFYRDALGVAHTQGQYHTDIWPVLYLDDTYSWVNRHAMGRLEMALTGDEGQIYCSNNFPRHVRATVGSQDGMQQQPWATLGWAAMGDGEKAVKPLQWCAKWVTSEINQGAWPEVAEDMPAYFTPPAGVFIWGTIEGLFGLKHLPDGGLSAAPCLPESWEHARLVTPEWTMTVRQDERRKVIWLKGDRPTELRLTLTEQQTWSAGAVRVNGQAVGKARVTRRRSGERYLTVRHRPPLTEVVYPRKDADGRWLTDRRDTGSWFGGFWLRERHGSAAARLAPDPAGVVSRRPLPLTADGRLRAPREWPAVWVGPSLVAAPDEPIADAVKARLGPGLTDFELAERPASPDTHWPLAGRIDTAALFAADADLRALALARCQPVELPATALLDDDGWRGWRWWSSLGHPPWSGLQPPLDGLPAGPIEPPDAPGLRFANPGGKLAVVSRHLGRPSLRLPLTGRASRLYVLIVPLLDCVDTWAEVGRLSVDCGDGTAFARTLHFPGDLDWWGPRTRIGDFATHDTDWCHSVRFLAPEAAMNVIEVDLNGSRPVTALTIETVGMYPCLAVAAVTQFGDPDPTILATLSERARQLAGHLPRRLFGFDVPSLDGWEVTGDAWGPREVRGDPWQRGGTSPFFADSLAHGEQATGIIRSAPFEITGANLTFLANGHGPRNQFRLEEAATGELLRSAPAPMQTGRFMTVVWDTADLRGRRVRFVAEDADAGGAYAWIAFDDILIAP